MLSELDFASFACYSPKGTSDIEVKAKKICGGIKSGKPSTIESIFKHFDTDTEGFFSDFLNIDTILIPVPRSTLLVPGGLWPSLLLANAFLEHGYAKSVSTCLKRVKPLAKSSNFTSSSDRPSVQVQLDTLEVTPELLDGISITLIDDVITAGRTAYACATKLKQAYPDTDVRVFSVIRTISFSSIDTIVEKCIGKILYYESSGKTFREDHITKS